MPDCIIIDQSRVRSLLRGYNNSDDCTHQQTLVINARMLTLKATTLSLKVIILTLKATTLRLKITTSSLKVTTLSLRARTSSLKVTTSSLKVKAIAGAMSTTGYAYAYATIL